MKGNAYIYIFTAALVSYLIRVLPLTLIRTQIKNKFIKSFLYYVPYVTLAVMTFPAIIQSTQSPWAGVIALVIGIVISYFGAGLFPVACVCCAVVFISEFFLPSPKTPETSQTETKTEIIQNDFETSGIDVNNISKDVEFVLGDE